MKPRRSFGAKKRTMKDKRLSLVWFLIQCRPEKLATYSADDLARMHGVSLTEAETALKEHRERPSWG